MVSIDIMGYSKNLPVEQKGAYNNSNSPVLTVKLQLFSRWKECLKHITFSTIKEK